MQRYNRSLLCIFKCIIKWPAWEEACTLGRCLKCKRWKNVLTLAYFVVFRHYAIVPNVHMSQCLGFICWTFLHCVFSNVSSNVVPEKRHSHIVCIGLTFLHCEFSYVSSNCLPEKRHSHIDCIRLAFLHCVSLQMCPKNCLPQKRNSHIGYICLTFLHCVFSNVSSNRLPEMMQSYTGCICVTFLHCAFSNVSSNRLPERMQSHIGCIC